MFRIISLQPQEDIDMVLEKVERREKNKNKSSEIREERRQTLYQKS